MSTLYNRYLQLKQEKCDVYYLFKYGIFYIFLDDDAKDILKIGKSIELWVVAKLH